MSEIVPRSTPIVPEVLGQAKDFCETRGCGHYLYLHDRNGCRGTNVVHDDESEWPSDYPCRCRSTGDV